MNIDRIKQKVLEQFGPDDEEIKEAHRVYDEISEYIELNFDVETHFAGSASRETCMAGDKDIDVFVLFPSDMDEETLVDKGLEIGEKTFKNFNSSYRTEYAEHPYTKGEINGHEVEIVPCYDVPAQDIKSSVDRTPHHTNWVKSNLSKEQRADVVVLKRFLSNADIYGSSLKTRGFSGYLCEILIAHFGSFGSFIESASDWSQETVIDPEGHHEDLPEELRRKFQDEPLKIIDPVDPERNVASVVSLENYARFVYLCVKFVEKPGMNYFKSPTREVSEFEISQELERRNHFIVMDFEPPQEVDDIVYPQMRKAKRSLDRIIDKNGFRTFDTGFFIGDRARFYFEVEPKLPEIEYVEGPKIFHGKKHVKEFRSKYDNVFIREDRLVAKTERKYTDIKDLLKDKMDDAQRIGFPERIAERVETFSFVDPVDGGDEWLKHLAEELHLEGDQEFLT